MKSRYIYLLIKIVLASLLPVSPLEARTWYILPDGNGDAPTIQAGIDSAVSGDIVEVACGLYWEHDLELKSGIILRGETGKAECVALDLAGNGRGFRCDEVDDVTIEGFTVQNGITTYGAGVLCLFSTLTVRHCVFSDGYAIGDGAITANFSTIEITDCDFLRNASFNEGAGAIYCWETNAMISGCKFMDNVAEDDGGGMWIINGSVSLTDCLFVSNHALGQYYEASGGALMFFGQQQSSHLISNCTFYGNIGDNTIHVDEGEELAIENTIIAFNQGSSLFVYNEVAPGLTCCDIYGNIGGDWVDLIQDQFGVQGNIAEDPQFCDVASGNCALMSSSPCAEENNLECGQIGALPVGCIVDAIGEETTPNGPVAFFRIHPNPFNPQTTISFSVDRTRHVVISVYDMKGLRVAVLADQIFRAGMHEAEWNGSDSSGQPVASGTYVVRLETDGVVRLQKISLLR